METSVDGNLFFGNQQPPWGFGESSGVAALGEGTMNLTSDVDYYGSITYAQTSRDTYTISSNGRTTTGSGNKVIYVVSPTKFVMIDVNPADAFPDIAQAEK